MTIQGRAGALRVVGHSQSRSSRNAKRSKATNPWLRNPPLAQEEKHRTGPQSSAMPSLRDSASKIVSLQHKGWPPLRGAKVGVGKQDQHESPRRVFIVDGGFGALPVLGKCL